MTTEFVGPFVWRRLCDQQKGRRGSSGKSAAGVQSEATQRRGDAGKRRGDAGKSDAGVQRGDAGMRRGDEARG